MRVRASLLPALVLGAGAMALAAPASAREGCAEAPTSTLVVNVKDKGAKGDGKTNDTAAIQAAIDEAGGTGGTVFVPNGTYMVDAVGKDRLALKSDMTLKMSKMRRSRPSPTIPTNIPFSPSPAWRTLR
jgi:polygalacturonase